MSVESLEDVSGHSHEEDLEIVEKKSINFRWPEEATKIIMEGVQNHAKPNVIKRNLKHAEICPLKFNCIIKLLQQNLQSFLHPPSGIPMNSA